MQPSEISAKQAIRLKLLYLSYKGIEAGKTLLAMAFDEEIRNGKFQEASQYLINEGLIENTRVGKISHSGIKTMEWHILHPNEASELFPPFSEI